MQKSGRMLKEEVDEEDVAEVVAKWTGIPVTRLLEAEVQKLVKMEERLAERVVGQREAIVAVANAVRRARSGLSDPNRPIGSFLFLGPTGVGKTELARALASSCSTTSGHDPHRHVEYRVKHTVARLIGAPRATSATRAASSPRRCGGAPTPWCSSTRPKAHADVFNVLFQLLTTAATDGGAARWTSATRWSS
jgi:ATP-dependent Clp protease ATP-binding subunit ClpB